MESKQTRYASSIQEAHMRNEQVSGNVYLRDFYGDFWIGDTHYQIEVTLPTKHTTPLAAKEDGSSLRFEKMGDEVVLVVWSEWHQGFDESGVWREYVEGSPIAIIRWEDWHLYKVVVQKPNIKDQTLIDGTYDYWPCSTPWSELFDASSLDDAWFSNVESLAYSVFTYCDV